MRLSELQAFTAELQVIAKRYGECHLRTLQRRLRGYRLQQIQKEMEQALEAP